MTAESDASREQLEDVAEDFFLEYLDKYPRTKEHDALVGLLVHVRDQARIETLDALEAEADKQAAATSVYDVSVWTLLNTIRAQFGLDEKEDSQGPT